LRNELFDEKGVFSTHGIELTETRLELESFPEPVRLNLWDFGGQEIYHGAHTLFLQGQAVFLVLWTPELESQTIYKEGEPTKRQHRLLEREQFDSLCAEAGGVSNPQALLDFLHHNGAVFYRPGLFGDRIVLDQNWALEAIYSIFHRDKCFKQFKKLHGRFSREDLENVYLV
jgi:hypothetical protein